MENVERFVRFVSNADFFEGFLKEESREYWGNVHSLLGSIKSIKDHLFGIFD